MEMKNTTKALFGDDDRKRKREDKEKEREKKELDRLMGAVGKKKSGSSSAPPAFSFGVKDGFGVPAAVAIQAGGWAKVSEQSPASAQTGGWGTVSEPSQRQPEPGGWAIVSEPPEQQQASGWSSVATPSSNSWAPIEAPTESRSGGWSTAPTEPRPDNEAKVVKSSFDKPMKFSLGGK
jgi:hypothetical protein